MHKIYRKGASKERLPAKAVHYGNKMQVCILIECIHLPNAINLLSLRGRNHIIKTQEHRPGLGDYVHIMVFFNVALKKISSSNIEGE